MMLAYLVLAIHVAIIAFNLVGLLVIPVGARHGWAFVRAPVWRALHLLSWGIVALQALVGRACFLTIWEDELTGAQGESAPLIMRWVESVVYWPLPLWAFTLLYIAAFGYAVALLWLVPPRWKAMRTG